MIAITRTASTAASRSATPRPANANAAAAGAAAMAGQGPAGRARAERELVDPDAGRLVNRLGSRRGEVAVGRGRWVDHGRVVADPADVVDQDQK